MRKLIAIAIFGLASTAALADVAVTGGFAYRYDSVQAPKVTTVNQDKMAAEVKLSADVGSNVKAVLGLATGSANTRFTTFGDNNSLKNIDLSLAYVEYAPLANAKIVIGKQYLPWATGHSYFTDRDIHPEGFTVAYDAGQGINLSGYSLTTSEGLFGHDSKIKGFNAGLNREIAGLSAGLTLGQRKHDYAVTQTLRAVYDLKTANVNVGTKLAGTPVSVFYDYSKNGKVASLNKATAYGVTFGKAKEPGSYDVSFVHQKVDSKALAPSYMDNEFAMGSPQNEGNAIVANYVVAKGWKVTGNYLDAKAGVSKTPNRHIMVDLKYMF
jgi:hypothetical protein